MCIIRLGWRILAMARQLAALRVCVSRMHAHAADHESHSALLHPCILGAWFAAAGQKVLAYLLPVGGAAAFLLACRTREPRS